ncbi:hypothetical protein ACFQ1S_27535, partial [Kibdelosporangium lantanae]
MIDPLWKWRVDPAVEYSSEGRNALLAGDLEAAGRIFAGSELAGDLVGLGDVRTLLGEVPVDPYEQAARVAPASSFVACGLSQSFVLRGEAVRAV